MYNEAKNRKKLKGSHRGPPWSFYTLIRKSYCYQVQWKCGNSNPWSYCINFPLIWITYISRHKIWILRVLLGGQGARFKLHSEISSFWKYSYKLPTNLGRPVALVGGLDSFPILCLMADLPIWMAKVISPEYWKWYGTIHAFLAQLQNVLYTGILATPSRIYIYKLYMLKCVENSMCSNPISTSNDEPKKI